MVQARKFTFDLSEDDGGGGSYAALEVPNDYDAELVKVEDFEGGKGPGWIFHYEVEGLIFKNWLSFSQASRWKLKQVFEAHGIDLEEVTEIDPNDLIGTVVGVRVDWEKDPATLPPGTKNYKKIQTFFDNTGLQGYEPRTELPRDERYGPDEVADHFDNEPPVL